ncbi:hypothetical protein [Longispora albida]|uniref:hypothetical protein n=1 Tax=Longispora albida TaxID=203523 RepID=UPI00036B65E7|nr:hypothetical protein [Longispora albida]
MITDLLLWCASCVQDGTAVPVVYGTAAGGAAALATAGGWMNAGAGPEVPYADEVAASPPKFDRLPMPEGGWSSPDGTHRHFPGLPARHTPGGDPLPPTKSLDEYDIGDSKIIRVYGDGEIHGIDRAQEAWRYYPPGAVGPDGRVWDTPTVYKPNKEMTGLEAHPGATVEYGPDGRPVNVHIPPSSRAPDGAPPTTPWPVDPGPLLPPGTPLPKGEPDPWLI